VLGNTTIDLATGKRFIREARITMEGFFQLAPSGQIERIYVWNSKLVQSEQNEKLHEIVQSHPEWSETDACKALKDAGALFGPNDQEAFLKSIHLDEFEKLLGSLRVASASFNGFANPDHAGDFALL
jgi:hypothetical protein